MKKNVLYSAIRKVFLDLKEVEHFIFWDSDTKRLKLKSLDVAHNTTVMSLSYFDYPTINTSFVLKDPEMILKCLDIAGEDLTIDLQGLSTSNCILISDSIFKSEIVITDINFIPPHVIEKKNTEPEEPISYDVVMDINPAFIDTFIKAKKANRSEVVSIWTRKRKSYFQLGDPNNFTNKIEFSIEMEGIFDMEPLKFSSNLIQIILERNKKADGKLCVEPQGLMKLQFQETIDDIIVHSVYFLVAQDNI